MRNRSWKNCGQNVDMYIYVYVHTRLIFSHLMFDKATYVRIVLIFLDINGLMETLMSQMQCTHDIIGLST